MFIILFNKFGAQLIHISINWFSTSKQPQPHWSPRATSSTFVLQYNIGYNSIHCTNWVILSCNQAGPYKLAWFNVVTGQIKTPKLETSHH